MTIVMSITCGFCLVATLRNQYLMHISILTIILDSMQTLCSIRVRKQIFPHLVEGSFISSCYNMQHRQGAEKLVRFGLLVLII